MIEKSMNKPIIVFTNFWDAEKIINQDYLTSYDEKSFYKIKLHNNPRNFTVKSIALSHPPLDRMPTMKYIFPKLDRLDMFCPTYDILKDYKDGGSWSAYTKAYRKILRDRKSSILEWLDSLKPNCIYILCCWENTSKGSNCHRELIYQAFNQSKTLRDKALFIKRSGGIDVNFEDSALYKKLSTNPSNVTINGEPVGYIPVNAQSETITDSMWLASSDSEDFQKELEELLQLDQNSILTLMGSIIGDEEEL
jgi:hypothetical protein